MKENKKENKHLKNRTRILERSIIGMVFILILTVIGAGAVPSTVPGVVYTATNNVTGNQVLSYEREANGSLILKGEFSTNGLGTGSSLGDQGSIILSDNKLLVVNAGSNEISTFIVKPIGLTFADKVNSGGSMPISITIHKDLVYVVNAGVPGNIVGYRLNQTGKLSKIPGSTQPLSLNNSSVGPAEISFNPDGNILVVTEKSTNTIDTYTVDNNGVAHGPKTHVSNGGTPFGFAFDKRGNLVVSEAATNTLSSYAINNNGDLKTISKSIPDFHLAPCWVVITKDGKFVYTNNAHDGTTSSYADNKGSLNLLNPIAGSPGTGNIDLALSMNNRFIYSLNTSTITGFKINADGNITHVGTVSVVEGAQGLAAR